MQVGSRVFLLYCGTIYEGKVIDNDIFEKKILCYNSQIDRYFETKMAYFNLYPNTEELVKKLIACRELFPEEEEKLCK